MSNVKPPTIHNVSVLPGPAECDSLDAAGCNCSDPDGRTSPCEKGALFHNHASQAHNSIGVVSGRTPECSLLPNGTTRDSSQVKNEGIVSNTPVLGNLDQNSNPCVTECNLNNSKKSLSLSDPTLCKEQSKGCHIWNSKLNGQPTIDVPLPLTSNLVLTVSVLNGSCSAPTQHTSTKSEKAQNGVPGGSVGPTIPEVSTDTVDGEASKLSLSWSGQEVKKRFTMYQKLSLFCVCVASFSSFLSMSIIAPFFPYEASLKGMTDTVSGFVFSIYALVTMISSPLIGKLLPIMGIRFCFISGLFVSGTCNILFGFLDQITDLTTFTVFCLVVRSFEAFGAASFSTASYAFIMGTFPDDLGMILGICETFVGLGMSIGPALGGVLYSIGGYSLSFYALGTLVILNIPMAWYLLKPAQGNVVEQTSGSYIQLLKMPPVLVLCAALMLTAQAESFLDPTLEPHLRQYGLGVDVVGLLFLLLSATYAISSPVVGWLVDKFRNGGYPIMVIGLCIQAASLIFLGPSPILPIEGAPWIAITSLAVNGIAIAMSFIPTFQTIMVIATDRGMADDVSTYGLVSGLWNGMFSMGEVLGPVVGGVLLDHVGFPWAATIIAACCLLAGVMVLGPWITAILHPPPPSPQDTKSNAKGGPTERTPLLPPRRRAFSCDTTVLA